MQQHRTTATALPLHHCILDCTFPNSNKRSVPTDQRRPLLILQDPTPPALREDPDRTPDDPHQRQDRKHERAPVYEAGGALLGEDGEEGPGDGDRGGEITFGRREGVGCRGSFEEEEGEEDEDLYTTERCENAERRNSSTMRAQKHTLVQMPALWSNEETPKASNAVKTTRTVVQPW